MLGTDVVVTQLQCFAQSVLQRFLSLRRERDVARFRPTALGRRHPFLDPLAHELRPDRERGKCLDRNALVDIQQPEQQVLGTDVVVVADPGLFLRVDYHSPRLIGEALEQGSPPIPVTAAASEPARWCQDMLPVRWPTAFDTGGRDRCRPRAGRPRVGHDEQDCRT